MIEVSTQSARRTLTLNRPDKANALTRTMLGAMVAHVTQARSDGIRVLVLTGRGKVFSAGADLEEAHAGLATDPVWEALSSAIASFPGLTIAALNGTCAGGALGMMLACDLRLAVPSARLFYPVLRNGFLPQPSDPARLVALTGPSRAKMILLGGQKIDSQTAFAWGLFDQVVEEAAMEETLTVLTHDALAAQVDLVTQIKAMCEAACERGLPNPAPASPAHD